MEAGNSLCSTCRYGEAKYFCSCTDAEILLCEGCLGKHITQGILLTHQARPIGILPYYKNPRSLQRLAALSRVQAEALQNLEDVDKAIAEITTKVQEIIEALQVLCKEKVEQLQEIKTILIKEIPFGLEELERERPLFNTKFGPLLRERTEHEAPLQLFSHTIETCSLVTLLRIHSQLIASQELTVAPFTGVYKDKAFLYDVRSQTIAHHTLSVNFGDGGSYVALDRDRILCVGAYPASSAVYLLDLDSFRLILLPSLSEPRFGAGIAKVNARIYVFGGGDASKTALRSCEKMDLSDKHWINMGSMTQSRGGFTPCHFRSLLYLVSCWCCSNRFAETFNPESETFTMLPISLLPQLTLKANSVAFVFNNELCVLTDQQQMLRWKVDTEREFRLSETGEILWSLQQPLLVGSVLLIACCGGVTQFSLETFSCIKRVA